MDTFDPPAEAAPQPAPGPKPQPVRTWWALALLLLFIVVPVIHLIGGAIVGYSGVEQVLDQAPQYDRNFDPVVVKNGEVSAGPRIIHLDPGSTGLLIDPDETVRDDQITSREAVIVRRTTVTRREAFRTQTYSVGELTDALGIDEMTVDSTNITAWMTDNRWLLIGGSSAFFGLVSFLDWGFLAVYALVDALLISLAMGFKRVPLKLSFPILLAVAVPTVLIRWLLYSVSIDTLCMGPVLWPVVMAIFGAPICWSYRPVAVLD